MAREQTDSPASLGLVDAPPERAFDTIVEQVVQTLGAPVSLLSIVEPEKDRQFFKAALGLPEPWASRRQTPLSHSFCRIVRETGRPLVVEDSRTDPRVAGNDAVSDLGVIAYLGVPIRDPGDRPLGALCAIGAEPRRWTDDDLRLLGSLGELVTDEIRLRAATAENERRRVELEAASRARIGLLARMSHEVRTPMNGVIGVASLLEEEVEDARLRARARLIRQTAEELMSVLTDVLDLSMIDADQLSVDAKTFCPAGLAERIVTVHRPGAEAKGLAISVVAAPEGMPARLGDPRRVSQILHNLVSNAVKFTETGSITVTVDGAAGGPLAFRVEDTGIGMSRAELDGLFLDHDRADPADARRLGGTGLGMILVRRLAELMGGTVGAESRPGTGTAVTVRLPLALADAPAPGRAAAPDDAGAPPEHSDLAGWRVLAVDDNATNRLVIGAALKRLGAEAVVASGGEDALAAMQTGRFDLFLLDILMPGMDGIETLRRLSATCRDRGLDRPPAIAVTASVFPSDVESYLANGFDGHVPKPARADDILHAARAAAAARNQGAEV